tara:strand:+ start:2820 stop:3179 length:360 start_codon:yes stop_codon:yes gene_type:complete
MSGTNEKAFTFSNTLGGHREGVEHRADAHHGDAYVYLDGELVATIEPAAYSRNHGWYRHPCGDQWLAEFVDGSEWEGRSESFWWRTNGTRCRRAMDRAKAWVERTIQAPRTFNTTTQGG